MPVFQFHVRVSDRGKPKLTSEVFAEVIINVSDVNDCPPQFSQPEYNATLLLPTYANVVVLQVRVITWTIFFHTSEFRVFLRLSKFIFQVNATDKDSGPPSSLVYELENNIEDTFLLDSKTGLLTIVDPSKIQQKGSFKMNVKVTDGKFTTVAPINIVVSSIAT